MSKIYLLSGTHLSGKSSLMKQIDNLLNDNLLSKEDIKIFHEINYGLFKIGFLLNGKGSIDELLFSQLQSLILYINIIKFYLKHDDIYKTIIIDRSFIDTIIYTRYFLKNIHNNYKLPQEFIDLEKEGLSLLNKLHHILIMPCNFSISKLSDKDRMNLKSRAEIHDIFTSTFKQWDQKLYTTLPDAPIEERSQMLLQIINL